MAKLSAIATLAICLFTILFVPGIFGDGMFFDGATYAAISRNLAQGLGTFTDPYYSATVPHFREHPPLVFLIQSVFFAIFGDHFYTEKIYALIVATTGAWALISCGRAWKIIDKDNWWLSLILWLGVPVVAWTYQNNLLEASMSVFCLAATTAIFKAIKNGNGYYFIAGALFLCLAGLSKGLTALFPLGIPFLYGILYKNYREGIVYQIILLLFTTIFSAVIIYGIPGMKDFLNGYLQVQILPSLQGKRDAIEDSRFWIIQKLLLELLIPIVLLLLTLFLSKRKNIQFDTDQKKAFLLLLFIGISASLPMMISPKQRAFYLTPSIPYFVLAFTVYISPLAIKVNTGISQLWKRIIQILATGAAASLIIPAILNFGKPIRDQELTEDINAIAAVVPKHSFIHTTPEIWEHWALHAQMNRRAQISLTLDSTANFLLIKKFESTDRPGFKMLPVKMHEFYLLRRSQESRVKSQESRIKSQESGVRKN